MVTFLCGNAGSGKSDAVAKAILNDLKNQTDVILLVPEQMAISAERRITDLALSAPTPIPTDRLEILNFSRLANRVFRTEGGISYQSVGVGGRTLIMWRALAECAPMLTEYRSSLVSPENTARMMLSAVQELALFGVTPAMMNRAADHLASEHSSLSEKLKDIALLYQTYSHLLKQTYDDPLEELPRLCAILREKNLFAEYHIYFDSFHGLTPQEFDVVGLLFRQAKQVTFSLCRCEQQAKLPAFAAIEEMFVRLCRMAGNFSIETVNGETRFRSPALQAVRDRLWSQAEPIAPAVTAGDAVRIFACTNEYEQAEQIAVDLARRVREEGCRYRDFAIIAGDATKYAGIIDAYLRRYQIPHFFSVRQDITQIPIIKLILTVLAIKQYTWRYEDVTDLLKTGLTPLDEDESDLLQAYADTWSIHGTRWTDEYDWTMHPRGYLSVFLPEDLSVLSRANDARRKLTAPMEAFLDSIIPSATVRSISEALYTFLVEFGVRERLAVTEPSRSVLIWNTVMHALDELVTITGDMTVNAEQYARLFTMLIRQTDIGRLPATVDEVVIGSASLLRAEGVKHVYLIGANDGEFPVAPLEGSIFSDSEKIALEGCGVVLSSTSIDKNGECLFDFWRAATCASDSLTVLYANASLGGEPCKPSLAVHRLLNIFPDLRPIAPDPNDLLSRLCSPETDLRLLSSARQSALGDALLRYYENHEGYAARLSALTQPLCQTNESLSAETAKMLYPGNLALSQTRLERFVKCPFAYHCDHVLKLRKNRPALIRPTDTGTFVHHILERFFRAIRTDDGINTALSDEELDALADTIINAYLVGIFGGQNQIDQQSGRLLALFRRLKRSTMLVIRQLIDEFKNSSFVPTFFEMPITFAPEENAVPPLSVPLEDGTKVYLIGRIDRVDTFKKGKDVYFRVVDYKTGSVSFSMRHLSLGLNMQMLLYLFAIWNNATPQIKAVMGVEEGGAVLPGGVMYCPAKPHSVSVISPPSKEDAEQQIYGKMVRSGILLHDEEILRAMDHTQTLRFLPIKPDKDGRIPEKAINSDALESLAGFGKLMETLSGQIETIAASIKAGDCRILPLKDSKTNTDACKYCEMRPLCRSFDSAHAEGEEEKGESENG